MGISRAGDTWPFFFGWSAPFRISTSKHPQNPADFSVAEFPALPPPCPTSFFREVFCCVGVLRQRRSPAMTVARTLSKVIIRPTEKAAETSIFVNI